MRALAALAASVVGLAILSVILSSRSTTPTVIGAAGQAFASVISAATAPVTGQGSANSSAFGDLGGALFGFGSAASGAGNFLSGLGGLFGSGGGGGGGYSYAGSVAPFASGGGASYGAGAGAIAGGFY